MWRDPRGHSGGSGALCNLTDIHPTAGSFAVPCRSSLSHRLAVEGVWWWVSEWHVMVYPQALPCRWLFNQAVCTLYAFCGVLFGLCSLSSLTVLSTVCCLKVCYPAYGRCWGVLPDLYLWLSLFIQTFFLSLWARSTSSGKVLPQGGLFPVNTRVQQS